ncbi:MAG: LysR family transcriptional regulator [Thermodesulfobacteriota bacterium]|nr:LysR family transcriptional regulator [Thermodesulfobacteriota bacterium]
MPRKTRPRFKPSDKDMSPADAAVRKGGYELKGRVWIEGASGTFLGCGRVVLLERIAEFGSISKAAKSMSMSYRHAWELVDSINRQAKRPLVETSVGGKKGGGTKLTKAGREAVEGFWNIYEKFKHFLEMEGSSLQF